jgi:hypothetical protein
MKNGIEFSICYANSLLLEPYHMFFKRISTISVLFKDDFKTTPYFDMT